MSLYKSIELPTNNEGKFILSKEALQALKKSERITIERSDYEDGTNVKFRCTYSAKVEGESERVDVVTSFCVNGNYNNPKEFNMYFTKAQCWFVDLLKENQELTITCRRSPIYNEGAKHPELVTDELKMYINRYVPATEKEILLDYRVGNRFDYGMIARKEQRETIEIVQQPLLTNQ